MRSVFLGFFSIVSVTCFMACSEDTGGVSSVDTPDSGIQSGVDSGDTDLSTEDASVFDSSANDAAALDVSVADEHHSDSSFDDIEVLDLSASDSSDSGSTTADIDTWRPEPVFGLSSQTLVHDGLTREYLLYVPESYDGTTEVPLMMNFHGWGGFASDQLAMSNMRPLADTENFILVYPQGSILEDDGFTHWNTYLPGGDNKSDADDFGFVDVMLDVLFSSYAIDASRVYAAGFSNGGDFSYTLACFLSDKIAGIASVSGLMWVGTLEECDLTHPTALISFHGTSDGARPYDGWDGYMVSIDDTLSYWNAHNNIVDDAEMTGINDSGYNIQRYQYEGGDGGTAVTHYKVLGGGHLWFSFYDDGVETDQLIWDFLSQFDRDGLR